MAQLRAESRDHYFTEYLMKLDRRLIQEKYQLDLMETELERSCRIYRQRMASEDMVMPGVENASNTTSGESRAAAAGAVMSGTSEIAADTTSEEPRAAATGEVMPGTWETASDTAPEESRTTPPTETQNIVRAGIQPGGGQAFGTYSTGNFSRQEVPYPLYCLLYTSPSPRD